MDIQRPHEGITITLCKYIPSFVKTYKINKQLEKIFNPSIKTSIVHPEIHLEPNF
jgi:hypothetical protein